MKAILAAFFLSVTFTGVAHAQNPNIVVFLSDDHSLLDSTVYGSKDVKTPAMERLASAGMTFERAFVASPSCAPSRASLLTALTADSDRDGSTSAISGSRTWAAIIVSPWTSREAWIIRSTIIPRCLRPWNGSSASHRSRTEMVVPRACITSLRRR
jgi:hypothetical protein